MEKILVTLDFGAIKNAHLSQRTFVTQDGQQVTKKELNLELVELPDPKKKRISAGQNQKGPWELWKTHFVCIPSNDREAPTVYVGEGKQFFSGAVQSSL